MKTFYVFSWKRHDSRFTKLHARQAAVLNAAARLDLVKTEFGSVTPLLRGLHWLQVPQRVCLLSSTVFYITWHRNISVTNFDVLLTLVQGKEWGRHQPWSTSALIIPVGDWEFPVAVASSHGLWKCESWKCRSGKCGSYNAWKAARSENKDTGLNAKANRSQSVNNGHEQRSWGLTVWF